MGRSNTSFSEEQEAKSKTEMQNVSLIYIISIRANQMSSYSATHCLTVALVRKSGFSFE